VVKGCVIAGVESGCGKTLVSLLILRWLYKQGIKVQPFKVGPDYIDSSWHFAICKTPSVNLDLFSMGKKRLFSWFSKYAKNADFALVEGVMGLCDGNFSTLEVAKVLKLPVILVVNVEKMAESVEPIVQGFRLFVEKENLDFYVVVNGVHTERHLTRVLKALKGQKVLGFIFYEKELSIPSRHLGLYLPEHISEFESVLDEVASRLPELINTEELLNLGSDEELDTRECEIKFPEWVKKVSVAKDKAFSFYYTHVLDEMQRACEVEFFSPINKEVPSSNPDVVYFGGGYPELFAEELEKNEELKKWLKDFVEAGGRVYAECGGLIYLCEKLHYQDKTYDMAGILPFEVNFNRLTIGYRRVSHQVQGLFFDKDTAFRGHEFHYSKLKIKRDVKRVFRCEDDEGRVFNEGFNIKGVIATYVHFVDQEVETNGEKAPLSGEEVEKESMKVISRFFSFKEDEKAEILKRIVHATAEPEIAKTVIFHPEAIKTGIEAIKKRKTILVDVEMLKAGVSKRLARGIKVKCYISEVKDVKEGTRASAGIEKGIKEEKDLGIIAIGNAPTALLKTIELLNELNIRDVLVIGTPVGFVKALEAKLLLSKQDFPFITNLDRRGGSPVAAAIINALLKIAGGKE